jgi:hypothetical protein
MTWSPRTSSFRSQPLRCAGESDQGQPRRSTRGPQGLNVGLAGATFAAAALHGKPAYADPFALISKLTWIHWSVIGLLILALAALLGWWRRHLLAAAWHWFVENIGGLLAPLRSKRHVIHDPSYLRSLLEAELNDDPITTLDQGAQARRSPPSGLERSRSGGSLISQRRSRRSRR